jgi:hypothetical protein
MPDVVLTFDYDLPSRTVNVWWTDLSGKGYIGKSLKSLREVGKERNKVLVETKWKVMGFNMKMIETLTLDSPNHWIWEPHMMGIQIVDDFHLEENDGRSTLHINSEFHPKGMKGKLVRMMFGRYLRKLMVEEWEAADKAFRFEAQSNTQNIR